MILIVDDKQENLYALKTLLNLHDYEVDTASSGEDALKKLLLHEYALIILDVQMPDMDGYEVAEAITGSKKTRDLPILFLSAVNVDKRFVTKGYNSGGLDYITKPFDPDLLLLKVKAFYRMYEQNLELKRIHEVLKKEVEMRMHAQENLQQMNLHLEDAVARRTKELVELNSELKSRNEELAQYAILASHDLQEPVRKIITFCRIIEEKYGNKVPEAAADMNRVIASAHRMRQLVNDLLDYSKLSGTLEFKKVDLNEVVHGTLSNLELVIEEKGAEVVVDDLPAIEGIEGQMRQMFQNLIDNALKFMQKGQRPHVHIWSERIEEKSLDALPSASGDFVRICIQDNGIGFNEQLAHKIFVIFQRLHGRNEYPGTGVGLSIVRKIVDNHHGLVWCSSKVGEGSTFRIVLPVKQNINHLSDSIPGKYYQA